MNCECPKQTNPSIRRLAEETLEALHSVQLRHEASSFYDDAIQTIESALTTLAKGYEERIEKLLERLEQDPGGSDKIDELESRIAHLRHQLATLSTQIREEDARLVEAVKARNECDAPECVVCQELDEIAAAIRARQEKP